MSERTALRLPGDWSPLDDMYHRLCAIPSDINQHLPTLRALASASPEGWVELGVRTGVSTVALMAGARDVMRFRGEGPRCISVDIHEPPDLRTLFLLGDLSGSEWKFLLSDSVRAVQDSTLDDWSPGLVFIDTRHDGELLTRELAVWGPKARRWIALHDTTTFGETGETRPGDGLWPAVERFLPCNREWTLEKRYVNNNGLTVLRRL